MSGAQDASSPSQPAMSHLSDLLWSHLPQLAFPATEPTSKDTSGDPGSP